MKSLFRLTPFFRPYKLTAWLLLLTVILPVLMELVVPRALNFVIDQGITPGDMTAIGQGSGAMLGAALIGVLATLGQGVFRANLSQGLAYDIRNKLFSHIQEFSFANLDRMQTGQLITRLSSDVDVVRIFMSTGLALLLRALLMVFGSLVMMLVISLRLAVIVLIVLPIAGLLIWGIMGLARPLFTIVQDRLSDLNTHVQENLAGVKLVKAFVRERYAIESFSDSNQDYMQANIRVGRLIAIALPGLTLLTNLGIGAVIWFGGSGVIEGTLSIGELVAFNNYLLIGMAPLILLGNILTLVSRAEASAERIWEILDSEPLVKQPVSPHTFPERSGRVVFDEVSFHYGGGQNSEANGKRGRDVLQGISFSAEPGEQVAILGATGSGKSSLLNLIPRFYDSAGGSIRIDDIDIRKQALDELRAQIGTALQQTRLFSGTVRSNIAFGRPDAAEEDVISAAKIAQAHEFILAMPEGYESLIEEGGTNLSGGQKQRIAIARALLIKPHILILDDSTSAVDMETEARIQEALEATDKKPTTFLVAQRISSVLNADKILVLDHGQIVAQGKHKNLIQTSALYREIFESQMGDGLEERA